jgi:hypothetical protein
VLVFLYINHFAELTTVMLQGENKPLSSLTVMVEGHLLLLPPGESRPMIDDTQPSVVFDDFVANFIA